MKPKSLEIFIPGPAGRLEAKYYKNPKFGSPVVSPVTLLKAALTPSLVISCSAVSPLAVATLTTSPPVAEASVTALAATISTTTNIYFSTPRSNTRTMC